METKTRSLLKGILWTLFGFVIMSLVGLAFTGSVTTGGLMAFINATLGLITYVIYERIWARIRWGRLDA
ncbi:Uncharacterized membrane protein [Pseudooceanicola antarcticus]|uniref:DUF2061 domain-containing protein n=1 Tax=Pseudooceanicola antarcticus TaxID=1247613 RepID=A0A285J9Z3_9RHOB|nr:DUF2061 domain-containing protein [Pseudooceanicola antarcticus]PJE30804.1 DUF2061 domain-containing protein [Pseudooceanicola antarcticus]SNY57130.1 Uncharacterized membrane protein [Pseudooceanicola antarcticus]